MGMIIAKSLGKSITHLPTIINSALRSYNGFMGLSIYYSDGRTYRIITADKDLFKQNIIGINGVTNDDAFIAHCTNFKSIHGPYSYLEKTPINLKGLSEQLKFTDKRNCLLAIDAFYSTNFSQFNAEELNRIAKELFRYNKDINSFEYNPKKFIRKKRDSRYFFQAVILDNGIAYLSNKNDFEDYNGIYVSKKILRTESKPNNPIKSSKKINELSSIFVIKHYKNRIYLREKENSNERYKIISISSVSGLISLRGLDTQTYNCITHIKKLPKTYDIYLTK